MTICMVGDSCTAMGLRWRTLMAEQRPEWDFDGTKTDGTYFHEGVGGDKTTDIIARLSTIPAADKYILLAGGNDLRSLTWRDVIVRNLQTIANALAAKGGAVYVLTPMPTALDGDVNIAINRLRFAIRADIEEHEIIDTYQAYVDSKHPYNELCIADKVHPSDLGYDVLAAAVLTVI